MAVITNTQLAIRVFLWGRVIIGRSLAWSVSVVQCLLHNMVKCGQNLWLRQFKRKRSPTFDSYHFTGLLPTADLPPWRPAVCRSLVEAAAASSYRDTFCSRFPIACAAANDHPWHMDID